MEIIEMNVKTVAVGLLAGYSILLGCVTLTAQLGGYDNPVKFAFQFTTGQVSK